MSRKAVIKFAEIVNEDDTIFPPNGEYDDLTLGQALGHDVIQVDCRDAHQEERFFPLPIEYFMDSSPALYGVDWFQEYNYYNYSHGDLKCCSDVPIAFHYITPSELYRLEYFVYHVHPFGVEKNITETLPRLLELSEIIAASDAKSFAPNFMNHTDYHNMTSSEKF